MQPSRVQFLALATTLSLAACGGGGSSTPFFAAAPAPAPAATTVPPAAAPAPAPAPAPVAEEKREQDNRNAFAPADPTATTFAAMGGNPANPAFDPATTSRWAGVLGGAAYRVEVPANWNGELVMYAHGYAGTGNGLGVGNPSIRRYLIEKGYAWAASSYSKNYYDVRVGVEDTNALALEFNKIAAAAGRPLAAPSKIFITGHSMGGHITAAAIEDEAYATANHKVRYNGAVPMCGVLGDTELFDYFAAAQVTAQALAGLPKYPFTNWADISTQVTGTLFSSLSPSIGLTATGVKYASVIQNLTGGPRPMFDLGLAIGGSFSAVWGVFGGDGTITGILNKSVIDTNRFVYAIDTDPARSTTLNAEVLKLSAVADANRLRTDGLRWIPKTNGEFKIPVVTLHTLGDLYVPFSMEQIYQKRVAAKGNGKWLVQRAIRGATHCDFTVAEQVAAFDAMVKWEQGGPTPAGDDVVTPAAVAAPSYGCAFTNNTIGIDDTTTSTNTLRGIITGTPALACPS
ncbi:alpha/beta hydrolase family protein [Variovorax saccharolyticus]|uniref:alpha/beta hydrolase family protein n=1 Tax=Variovorax saccharolyticus TaxID=3053516 RepID=UPI0025781774|nr:alpha/beta hydrolase [Variovorax sp. J31P216]MDM0024526.1 alpha/beta hydrolase [Variovorax sp. J31P216]